MTKGEQMKKLLEEIKKVWRWIDANLLARLGRWRIPVLAVAALLLVFVIYKKTLGSVPDVATASARFGDFVIDINQSGELYAVKSVSVGVPAKVRGSLRVVALAEDGTMVQKGDFLVQFDTAENRPWPILPACRPRTVRPWPSSIRPLRLNSTPLSRPNSATNR